jgi:hypothetical protein
MAISFLQDNLDLSIEEWNVFFENIDNLEFEVNELGTFGFIKEGLPEFSDSDRRYGHMIYVVEDLEENNFYLFTVEFIYSDHYDLRQDKSNLTLIAISKSDSLNY